MRRLGIVAAAAFLSAPALAICQSAVQVGTVTSDPEKDTLGFRCVLDDVTQTSLPSGVLRQKMVQIGVRTGQPEKDTFGYALAPPRLADSLPR